MKISYISKTNTWNDKQFLNENNHETVIEKISLENLNDSTIYKSFGDVIFWRSSNLNTQSARPLLLNILKNQGKIIINQAIIDYPSIIYKQYQQEYIKATSKNVKTIPTFTFSKIEDIEELINKKELSFPFIKKPNLGSKGEGIVLIKNRHDLELLTDTEIQNSIFQNFIENDGDYRVIVIGGIPINAIKRVGKDDSFLNNVSMGGNTLLVTDEKLKEKLFTIASRVAATVNLGFCGIDIIEDKNNKELYFLELNTVPQWEGFQKCTNINIAKKIVTHCKEIVKREHVSTSILVKDCYVKNIDNLSDKKFHFFTRMFLWTKENKYLKELEKNKAEYFGKNDDGFKNMAKHILEKKEFYKKRVFNNKDFRLDAINKYPLLGSYSELLFRNLMSKNIFNIDLKPLISEFVTDSELLKLRDLLLNNEKDILALSTFAVNYLYFIEEYFSDAKEFEVDVEKLFKITNTQDFGTRAKNANLLINDIYFLTHIIINASRFYKNKIIKNRKTYIKIFNKLEEIIELNYIKVSLDTKLELLVCAKLLKTKSSLDSRIKEEAELSLSPINNFLVDTFNIHKNNKNKSWLDSEHRNVLYIMLNS